jgi:hypothetical protein
MELTDSRPFASLWHSVNGMKRRIKPQDAEAKSPGTVLSEKLRARANKHSDQEREKSIAEGLAIIYGGRRREHAKSANRS